MKAIAIILVCIASAIAQEACCAPSQWTGYFKTFQHDGKFSMNSAMVDATNNRAFITTTEDPEVNVLMWFLPKQGVFYTFDVNNNQCYSDNFTNPVQTICVGGANDTFLTTTTIGDSVSNVWQTTIEGEIETTVVTNGTCIPIAIESDGGNGPSRFDDMTIFYNIKAGINNFPPVPPQCTSDALKITERAFFYPTQFMSRIVKF